MLVIGGWVAYEAFKTVVSGLILPASLPDWLLTYLNVKEEETERDSREYTFRSPKRTGKVDVIEITSGTLQGEAYLIMFLGNATFYHDMMTRESDLMVTP